MRPIRMAGDTVSYSLDDDAGGLGSRSTPTPESSTVAGCPGCRDGNQSHDITIRATSSDTSFSTTTLSISINDMWTSIDTGAVTDSDAGSNTVAEDAIVGTTAIGVTGLADRRRRHRYA